MPAASEVLDAIRALPDGTVKDIVQSGTPIILAPHPDDEVIGCGALIAAAARADLAPVIVFVTDGSGSHPNSRAFPRDALIALRQNEARAAAERLGVDLTRVHFMGIPDTAAPREGPALADAVETIARIIAPYDNPVIFAPWTHDPHRDHRAVREMAVRVARVLGARHLSYLVWAWLLPKNRALNCAEVSGWRFPTKNAGDQKFRALSAYQSQISNLIDDDPTGFRFDRDMLSIMLSNDEVFLANP